MIKRFLTFFILFSLFSCQNNYTEYVILKLEDNTVTLAPSNYDKDAPLQFENEFIQKQLAKEVSFKSKEITTIVNKYGFKMSKNKTTTLSEDDLINNLKDGNLPFVRIYTNNKDEITEIILWGESIVYE